MTIPVLEVKAASWVAQKAAYLIAAGLIAVVLGLIYWAVIARPAAIQQEADRAHAGAVVGGAQTQAAQQAIPIISQNAANESATNILTGANHDRIVHAKGADAQGDPAVFDAFLRGFCLRPGSTDLPDCQRLRGAGP